jgi:murein DD-endopeptidase MepM/ murein hydrolase activator NlpD
VIEKEKKDNSWRARIERLTERYRLILLKEQTYEERYAINTSILRVIFLAIGFTILVIALVTLLFMFTPLKNTIPGYVDDQWKRDAKYARAQVDSLYREMRIKDQYLSDIQTLLQGEVIPSTDPSAVDSSIFQEDAGLDEYSAAPVDSALRVRVTNEDRYLLSVNQIEETPDGVSQLYLFQPLGGMVSSEFNARINHYGIDIVAQENSLIKAVLQGTVVFASWTSDGGYEIHVQHPYNLISVYKHNSVLLKKLGDHVEAGDAIAIIGDSGDHTDGPHLHLEIWKNGVPVDPAQYFVFEK